MNQQRTAHHNNVYTGYWHIVGMEWAAVSCRNSLKAARAQQFMQRGATLLTNDLTVSLRASFSAASARTDASLSRTICRLRRSSASTPSSCLVNASGCLWSAARNLYRRVLAHELNRKLQYYSGGCYLSGMSSTAVVPTTWCVSCATVALAVHGPSRRVGAMVLLAALL
jgi:hypothetical protein